MARQEKPVDADAKVVVLVHPEGAEYGSNSPTEINKLVFGQGYKFRDVSTFDEALAHLGDEAAVESLPAHPAPNGAVNLDDAGQGADETTPTD